ncbi:MAG: outer rane chaperone Skp (OmpH) [Bacteroidetes bacterium]|jgi:outer membrane protein|nr:outer rane chaperone Skp (OmpH) [Bacteroidota bacterium]
MEKITKTIALLIIGTVIGTAALAQKVAHVKLDSLISLMPESKKAQDMVMQYGKMLEKEIVGMQTELNDKIAAFQNDKTTGIVKENKEKDLQNLQQRIESFREQANQDYQQKTAEISKPIYEKAKKGIEAVAKEGGYKYVLDTSTGLVLYTEASDDILPLVKKKLDSMPEAVLPGAPPAVKAVTTPAKPATTPAKTGGK